MYVYAVLNETSVCACLLCIIFKFKFLLKSQIYGNKNR